MSAQSSAATVIVIRRLAYHLIAMLMHVNQQVLYAETASDATSSRQRRQGLAVTACLLWQQTLVQAGA